MKTENYDNELSLWIEKEKTISELSNIASRLILEHATELVLFRNRIKLVVRTSDIRITNLKSQMCITE